LILPAVILPADPRLRLVTAGVAVAALSQIESLAAAIAALAATIGLAILARAPLPWRRLLHLEGFLILLFLTLPFTVPGPPLAKLGPLAVSSEGLLRAALIAGKVSASVLIIALLLGGMDPTRLGAALRALRLPEPLVRLFVTTARYLDLIRGEAGRLLEAMRARGFRPGTNRHSWRSYGHLLGMLLVRALARAERVEEAMLCRGYAGRLPNTPTLKAPPRDRVATALIVGAALSLLLCDRLWMN